MQEVSMIYLYLLKAIFNIGLILKDHFNIQGFPLIDPVAFQMHCMIGE